MADFTLGPARFPVGTTVGAYPRTAFVGDTGPLAVPVDTAVVDANLEAAFSGLEFDTQYWAAAQVDGSWRRVSFRTDEDESLEAATKGYVGTSVAAEVAQDRARLSVVESTQVIVAAPTGVAATDTASWQAAFVAAASGGRVMSRPGVYVVNWNALNVPNDVTVHVIAGSIVRAAPNTATGAGVYVLFASTAIPPLGPFDVTFIVDGEIDGNRSNGNHGLSENVHGISMSNGTRITLKGTGRIHNFRGESLFMGRTGGGDGSGTIPNTVRVNGGLKIHDVGIKEVGDGGNTRQGLAFQAGTDILVDDVDFADIDGYCVDFEADYANDIFDNCVVGENCTYRNIGQGTVNFSYAAAVAPPSMVTPTCRGPVKALIAGTFPSVNIALVPDERARFVQKTRTAGDVLVDQTTWEDISTALDLVIPAQPEDNIEVEVCGMWSNDAIFAQLDVAIRPATSTATTTLGSPDLTLVTPTTGWVNGMGVLGPGIPSGTTILSGAGTATMVMSANATASAAGVTILGAARYIGSRGGSAPCAVGVVCWRPTNGAFQDSVGGSVSLPLLVTDLVSGTVTLRLRGSVNGGGRTLFANTDTPLYFRARNLGGGW